MAMSKQSIFTQSSLKNLLFWFQFNMKFPHLTDFYWAISRLVLALTTPVHINARQLLRDVNWNEMNAWVLWGNRIDRSWNWKFSSSSCDKFVSVSHFHIKAEWLQKTRERLFSDHWSLSPADQSQLSSIPCHRCQCLIVCWLKMIDYFDSNYHQHPTTTDNDNELDHW